MSTDTITVDDIVHTPAPWRWLLNGLSDGKTYNPQVVMRPEHSINPDKLDPPLPPNTTGPRYWAAYLGASGDNATANAHFNGMLIGESPAMFQALKAIAGGVADPVQFAKTFLDQMCERA